MPLRFHLFDPLPCRFPRSRVPLLPRLSVGMFHSPSAHSIASRFIGGDARFYARGRYALRAVYQLAGIGPHGLLLAPSYHCPTMLDPAFRIGAEVLLYPLKADLAPDLDALVRLIEGERRPIKALLISHYFGIPQNCAPVAEFCAARGIVLIEDCCHAFFGRTVGFSGDYAVASPYKFFACDDGGMLVANHSAGLAADGLMPAAWGIEFRAIARLIRSAWDRRRGRVTRDEIDRLPEHLEMLISRPLIRAVESEGERGGPSIHYRPADERRAGLEMSRWIMQHSDMSLMAEQRRANYRAWLNGVATLPNCRALYSQLPADCVPYMFPVVLDAPDPHFYLLKHLGVPIWRWDEMALSDCPVATGYRLRVIHLPCHQDLHSLELEWMIAAVTAVMRCPATVST